MTKGQKWKAGLIKEEGGGYVRNKVFYENTMKIRRTVLPLQTAYALFFLTALVALTTILRPARLSSTYVLAVIVTAVAVAVAMFEGYKASKFI